MRTQNKSTISYMFRNFWRLFYVTLPVSVLIAFFCTPNKEVTLFCSLVTGEVTLEGYVNMLMDGLTLLRFGKYWWIAIIAIILLAYAMCLMVVKLDRHMRVGKMPALPLKRSFGIFPNMLLYIIGWLAVRELLMLIIVGISYMVGFIGNATAIVSIAFVLDLAAQVFVTYIFGALIMAFPLKYSENYRFNVAMAYSARTMSKKRKELVALAFSYPFARVAVMAIAYLLSDFSMGWLIYAVAITLCLMFVPVYAFKKFYDDVGGERRDLVQIMFD